MRMDQEERRFDFHGLGAALKRAREEKGWTQAYVAELVDRDSRTIMNIENKGQYPSFDLFVKLITMFDVSVDQFIHADGGATVQEKIRTGEIIFSKDETRIIRKIYLSTLEGRAPETIWFGKDVGTTREAMNELKKLFDKPPFDTPKPTGLIKKLQQLIQDKEYVVLDFFSGSATTAHAVLQLNAEDGGHRKFIMVQLPEQTDVKGEAYKVGYKTICDIGEERIRRAGKKIKEENPLATADLDIGFRVFKVDSSNMEDVYYRPTDYNQGQMELFADNIKPDRTPEDLLFQVMLDLGILLSSDIQETEIAGKKVFSVADGYLIACFDKDITEGTVKAIAQKQPVYAVFRDSSMASDSVATNFEQIFETYSPKTQRKVL